KNIGIALHQHVDAHQVFPAGFGARTGESYLVHLLPYLGEQPLRDSIDLSDDDSFDASIGEARRNMPSFFRCPSDSSRAIFLAEIATNYPANAGRNSLWGNGPFIRDPVRPRDITDGLSQPVGVTEWVVGPGTIGIPGYPERHHRLGTIYSFGGL